MADHILTLSINQKLVIQNVLRTGNLAACLSVVLRPEGMRPRVCSAVPVLKDALAVLCCVLSLVVP